MRVAARELLEQGGLAALTMRRIAAHLKVAPNALYSHVESKTALLDDLLDDLLAEVRAPDPELTDPIKGLATMMTSTYDVLTRHPTLVPYYLAQHGSLGPNAVRLGACMDRLLARAGVKGKQAFQARRVLIIHAIASAAFATSSAVDASYEQPIAPLVSRRNFAQSLRWLLAGITATEVSRA